MRALDDLLSKAQKIADRNGDGKVDTADLETLKQGLDDASKEKVSALQDFADKNNDDKVDIEDLKLAVGDIANSTKGALDSAGKAIGGVKDKLFGGK